MLQHRLAALAALCCIAIATPVRAQEERKGAPDDARPVRLPEAAQEQPKDAMVRTTVDAIVRAAAEQFGAHAWLDPQVVEMKVAFASAGPITWGALKLILDQHDVVVVDGRAGPGDAGPWVLRAHHRRNLNQREGPAWRLVDAKAIPTTEEIVTVVLDVAHGDGNSIFAAVRGLLTRDTNRIGNILYLPGSEKILIVDIASKVRYYAEVVARLDVAPAARPSQVVRLAHASPERVAAILEEVLGLAPGPTPQTFPIGTPLRAAPDARTRQVVLTGDEATLAAAARLAQALDVEAEDLRARITARHFAVGRAEPRAVVEALAMTLRALEAAGGTRQPLQVLLPHGKRISVVGHVDDMPLVEELLRELDTP